MNIVSLVLKSLEGGVKLLQRDAVKADAVVDANRQKQVDLLVIHRDTVTALEAKIVAENERYKEVRGVLQLNTAKAVKCAHVDRRFADAINQLIYGETS